MSCEKLNNASIKNKTHLLHRETYIAQPRIYVPLILTCRALWPEVVGYSTLAHWLRELQETNRAHTQIAYRMR